MITAQIYTDGSCLGDPIFKSFPSELHIPKNSITTEFDINLQ